MKKKIKFKKQSMQAGKIGLILPYFLSIFIVANGQEQKGYSKEYHLNYNGINLFFTISADSNMRFRSMLPNGFTGTNSLYNVTPDSENETSLHISGENRDAKHGLKFTGGNPGMRLKFVGKEEKINQSGRIIILKQEDSINQLYIESFYEFKTGVPVVRRYTTLQNRGSKSIVIDFLSSAMLHNYDAPLNADRDKDVIVHYAFNTWLQEAQWKQVKLVDLGWIDNGENNLNKVEFSNIGSMSTLKYLPMAMIENRKAGVIWFWQIEHNGSWHWETSNTTNRGTYVYIGGPDEENHHAKKVLSPGEIYTTVPVAVGCVQGGFNEAVAALTKYRRTIVTPHVSYKSAPVIFNDYMNCLSGQPTTAKELPLINAAAEVGCKYFVIDAGWYSELNENWSDKIGEWKPSSTRFGAIGLLGLLDIIREKGMIPGLWIEPEIVGVNSEIAKKPDDWFFLKHGKRIVERNKLFLDYRNPNVIKHMNAVIRRLVSDYHIGYIKIDYNNLTWGTESSKGGLGQGLLEHNVAFLNWLKEIVKEYPQLTIENCASGGCRMDYAMLSTTHIQSSSDQDNYKKYPAILVGALAAVLPEQLAIWSYPSINASKNEVSFNMVSAMAARTHQSGFLYSLNSENFQLVKNAIRVYSSTIAPVLHRAIPFFPLGMPAISDSLSPICVGLKTAEKKYLYVWCLRGAQKLSIPIKGKSAKLLYPLNLGIGNSFHKNSLRVSFKDHYMAAIFEIQDN
jgi:alpha-galactosidase